jgi:hypothetical protein
MPRLTIVGHAAAAHVAEFTRANARPSDFAPGCFDSESLCRVQSELWRARFLEAEIMPTAYGYSLRHASGLENFALIASSRRGDVDGTFESALRAAEAWVAEDPTKRTVCMHADYFRGAIEVAHAAALVEDAEREIAAMADGDLYWAVQHSHTRFDAGYPDVKARLALLTAEQDRRHNRAIAEGRHQTFELRGERTFTTLHDEHIVDLPSEGR